MPTPDGTLPGPGGWPDRPAGHRPSRRRRRTARQGRGFRRQHCHGTQEIRQILIQDPSGNLTEELFEPLAAYHERSTGHARAAARQSPNVTTVLWNVCSTRRSTDRPLRCPPSSTGYLSMSAQSTVPPSPPLQASRRLAAGATAPRRPGLAHPRRTHLDHHPHPLHRLTLPARPRGTTASHPDTTENCSLYSEAYRPRRRSNSRCDPDSSPLPLSMTLITSALTMVDSPCAIAIVIRAPFSASSALFTTASSSAACGVAPDTSGQPAGRARSGRPPRLSRTRVRPWPPPRPGRASESLRHRRRSPASTPAEVPAAEVRRS